MLGNGETGIVGMYVRELKLGVTSRDHPLQRDSRATGVWRSGRHDSVEPRREGFLKMGQKLLSRVTDIPGLSFAIQDHLFRIFFFQP